MLNAEHIDALRTILQAEKALLVAGVTCDDAWITVKPRGKGKVGSHVLLGPGGVVKAGMGGKFTGKPISQAKSKSGQSKSKSKAAAVKPAAAKPVKAEPIAKPPVKAAAAKPAKKAPHEGKEATPKTVSAKSVSESEQKKVQSKKTDSVTGSKAHDAASVDLDRNETEAVKNYCGAMYRDVNPKLRAGKPVAKSDRKDVERMDTAFAKSSTKEPITVYRGVSGDVAGKLEKGATFQDGGFVSTSTKKDSARNFVRGDGAALMEVRVPTGAKAMSVRDVSQFGKSEQEILLNRGGRYKVVEVKKATRTRPKTIIVEMEQ